MTTVVRQKQAAHKRYHFLYKTVCLVTRKHYFGMHSTDNVDDGYLGSGKLLKYSIRKYGKENHVREIFGDFFSNREDLRLAEAELIKGKILDDPQCLNLVEGGGAHDSYDVTAEKLRGRKHTQETCFRISEALKGKPGPMLGRKMSNETKKKLSDAKKGKKQSEEHRRKNSESHRGQITWMKGKQHSKEAKQMMSKSHLGKPAPKSLRMREKLSKTLTGKKRPEVHREAMRAGWANRRQRLLELRKVNKVANLDVEE